MLRLELADSTVEGAQQELLSVELPHLAIVQVVAQKLLLLQRLQRVQRLLYCQVSSLAPHGLLTVGVCNLNDVLC